MNMLRNNFENCVQFADNSGHSFGAFLRLRVRFRGTTLLIAKRIVTFCLLAAFIATAEAPTTGFGGMVLDLGSNKDTALTVRFIDAEIASPDGVS